MTGDVPVYGGPDHYEQAKLYMPYDIFIVFIS